MSLDLSSNPNDVLVDESEQDARRRIAEVSLLTGFVLGVASASSGSSLLDVPNSADGPAVNDVMTLPDSRPRVVKATDQDLLDRLSPEGQERAAGLRQIFSDRFETEPRDFSLVATNERNKDGSSAEKITLVHSARDGLMLPFPAMERPRLLSWGGRRTDIANVKTLMVPYDGQMIDTRRATTLGVLRGVAQLNTKIFGRTWVAQREGRPEDPRTAFLVAGLVLPRYERFVDVPVAFRPSAVVEQTVRSLG